MSCHITVTLFPARDRTNAFAVAKNLTTHVNRHKKDIIAQNQMAMPSIREAGRAPQDVLREWDRDWAFSLLAQKFLFYPKYQLLTLMGGPLPGLDQSSRSRSRTARTMISSSRKTGGTSRSWPIFMRTGYPSITHD